MNKTDIVKQRSCKKKSCSISIYPRRMKLDDIEFDSLFFCIDNPYISLFVYKQQLQINSKKYISNNRKPEMG